MQTVEHPLVRILSECRPSAQYVALMGYVNSQGEISNYSFLLNISYPKAVQKSILLLSQLNFESSKKEVKWSKEEFLLAKNELTQSLLLSSQGENHSTSEAAYQEIYGYGGKKLKGCKLHSETHFIHLYGFIVHRLVVRAGEKKVVKSSGKTLAKNWLRSNLPIGKFVQFRLEHLKYERLSLGNVFFLSEEIPELNVSEVLEMKDE